MKKHDSRTALRLPHKQREQIDQLVAQGKFENLSHVIRAALADFLENQKDGDKPNGKFSPDRTAST